VQRRVVWLITFGGGLFFLLEFLLPAKAPAWMGGFENPLTQHLTFATNLVVVIGTMALLVGPFNLLRSHVSTLLRKKPGWIESSIFLAFLIVGITIQINEGSSTPNPTLRIIYNGVFYGLSAAFGASSMAMLAFYLVSAAHRAFRINGIETALMMTAAIVILLGMVPFGDWMTQGLPKPIQLPSVAQWILNVPNTAVQRAVIIGACGGAFTASMRHWLGIGKKRS